MAVDNVSLDVRVKIGDFWSNGFRDFRGADYMSNEQYQAPPNSALSPKNELERNSSRVLISQTRNLAAWLQLPGHPLVNLWGR